MRIIVVDTTLSGDLIGGAQTFLIKLLDGLVRVGNDVVFASGGEPNGKIAAGLSLAPAKQSEIARAQGGSFVSDTTAWTAGRLVEDVTPLFAAWLNRLRPDVFVISVSGDIGWSVLPHLNHSIATLTIGHNDEETFYAPVRHYKQFLTRAIGVSEEICRKYVEECGMPGERVEWIPYGVETSENEPVASASGRLRLAYVGRFDSIQKRIGDVVTIIKRLGEAGVDFRFDLVGDGEEMPNVKSALVDEIASGRVNLHGWVASEDVIRILRSSEVFVLASAYEGFCISLTEAMANGCCPVVSDIASGNKQLVEDGRSGFVVPIGDIDSFVGRIRTLSNDRDLLARMRTAAWETGREYGVERMVDNYVDCFERAIEDVRANRRTPDPSFPLMESCRSVYPLWLRRLKARVVG